MIRNFWQFVLLKEFSDIFHSKICSCFANMILSQSNARASNRTTVIYPVIHRPIEFSNNVRFDWRSLIQIPPSFPSGSHSITITFKKVHISNLLMPLLQRPISSIGLVVTFDKNPPIKSDQLLTKKKPGKKAH